MNVRTFITLVRSAYWIDKRCGLWQSFFIPFCFKMHFDSGNAKGVAYIKLTKKDQILFMERSREVRYEFN